MKTFYLFIASVLFFSGCSDDAQLLAPSDSSDATANTQRLSHNNGLIRAFIPNAQLLQKVVRNPGSAYERQFNFYPNGLLKNITNAGGTILEHFEYDANGNLVSCFSSGAHTFTYDGNNHLTSVDGYPVVYDAIGSKYVFQFEIPTDQDPYDYQHRTEIAINADGYLLSKKAFFNQPAEFYMTAANASYNNGNMGGFGIYGGETGEHYQFDTHANPLKSAMAAVSRAIVLVNPSNQYGVLWMNGEYTSTNNIVSKGFMSEDPETYAISYTYNDLGLPVLQTTQPYSSGTIDGPAYVSYHYYYQGDVIP